MEITVISIKPSGNTTVCHLGNMCTRSHETPIGCLSRRFIFHVTCIRIQFLIQKAGTTVPASSMHP
ncbi:hypothetical protein CBFG_00065 [Clostridiales bacterium 1_7_47FAA]|nr:hypothetical protein CBFG_00065 [Clostridiales bacterium 1_7_47FAA]